MSLHCGGKDASLNVDPQSCLFIKGQDGSYGDMCETVGSLPNWGESNGVSWTGELTLNSGEIINLQSLGFSHHGPGASQGPTHFKASSLLNQLETFDDKKPNTLLEYSDVTGLSSLGHYAANSTTVQEGVDLLMAKISKVRRMLNSRSQRVAPYPLQSHSLKVSKHVHRKKKGLKSQEKKEWEDATCSVCMEHPHNAVLLLCSSYNKGCRPYMCATSTRYSNCLEQYKKAYTKVTSAQITESLDGPMYDPGVNLGLGCSNGKMETSELLCPLCRGQVKGWTVVEPARKYLNTKRRTCMQDNCSFIGTYKELKRHVKAEHPWARPREVDPSLAEKWKRLEHEREQEDVISTIRSSMPGAIVIGDYVIERPFRVFSGDHNLNDYHGDSVSENGYHSWDDEDIEMDHDGNGAASGNFDNNFMSRFPRYRNRFLSGRLRRRRRRSSNRGR